MDSSTIVDARPPDRERIDRILNLVEHAWKLHPDRSLLNLLDGAAPEGISDEELEAQLREYVRRAFAHSRDET